MTTRTKTTTHTPGPWTLHEIREEVSPSLFTTRLIIAGADGSTVARFSAGLPHDDANARLIAQAPAMLATVRYVALEPCHCFPNAAKPSPTGRCHPCDARAIIRAIDCGALNRCPWCGQQARCGATHFGRKHQHLACSYACAKAREAERLRPRAVEG